MKDNQLYLILILAICLVSCEQPIAKYEIEDRMEKQLLELYSDSTFTLETSKELLIGNWNGKLEDGEIISITPKIANATFLTLLKEEYYKIENGYLKVIQNYEFKEGIKLSERVNLDKVQRVKINNEKGPHYLSDEKWKELKDLLSNSLSIGGIYCKPNSATISFERSGNDPIQMFFCNKFINYDEIQFGSFEIPSEIDFSEF